MVIADLTQIIVEQKIIPSIFLGREVVVDFYVSKKTINLAGLSLLLVNDGQDLDKMPFAPLFDGLLSSVQIKPLLVVGIYCNKDRREEYATASQLDYIGRGTKSKAHQQFIVEELIPFIHTYYAIDAFHQKAIAGFSLGGLSALDTAWHHPEIFSLAGIFSGSLWWRSKAVGTDYNDDKDRIMHNLIRQGQYKQGLRFYFTTGSMDETADRNQNGIIDSIDDTLDLVKELVQKGYDEKKDISYINYEDGKHDVATWGRAMPEFLKWGWGSGVEEQ